MPHNPFSSSGSSSSAAIATPPRQRSSMTTRSAAAAGTPATHSSGSATPPTSGSPSATPLQPTVFNPIEPHRHTTTSNQPRSARTSLLNVLSSRAVGTTKTSSKTAASAASDALLTPGNISSSASSLFSTSSSASSILSISQASTASSFDAISLPPAKLSGDLSAILEHPLPPNATAGSAGHVQPPTAAVAIGVMNSGKSGAKHSEFGWCNNANYRWTSQYNPNSPPHVEAQPPYYILICTYISYLLLIVLGHLRDFFGKKFNPAHYAHLLPKDGYAALNSDFDSFYTRRLKKRLDDCFSRPTTGVAGRTIMLYDRASPDYNHTFKLTGTKTRALNISSYNYLGFAQATGGCADAVETAIKRYGVSAGGARLDAGTLDLHVQTEKLVSQFVGTEDAMVVSMGFATNSTTIPALVEKGCLVISDEFNHSSIRFGVRLSGAIVRQFKHNDMKSLEVLLRESISQGQPRTHRPWKKILVIVEGLYSMEGSLVDLPNLIELKARYKFYLYVDEAHSIGALGPNGRGVCDYFGINPRSIDILMGTFTKSFGAAGGYIAGSKETIDRLRLRSHAMCYAESMSPAVLAQVLASMSSIMGVSPPLTAAPSSPTPVASSSTHLIPPIPFHQSASDTDLSLMYGGSGSASIAGQSDDEEEWAAVYGPAPSSSLPSWLSLPPSLLNGTEGRERLRRLAFNSRYLSSGLRKLGFIVYGSRDSPIVPLLLFQPAKMPLFSRMMLERIGVDKTPIVVVVVAYPATPLISSRVRFCVSAAHTKQDIDLILRACDEVGDVLDLKHGKGRWTVDEVIRRAEELVAAD